MTVSLLVPFRGSSPERVANWEWLRQRYERLYPEWEIVEGEAPDGVWSKGAAVYNAFLRSSGDIVVMADADVWVEGLPDSVELVEKGVTWAVPQTRVYRLTPEATEQFKRGDDPVMLSTRERRYVGIIGGGMVVMRRETYQDVPIDPRFLRWGGEDLAWAHALRCLHGKPWRGSKPLVHLWHPPQDRESRRVGSVETNALYERYRRARRDRSQMRALLDEIQWSDYSV